MRAVLQLQPSHLLDRSLNGNPNCGERERKRERGASLDAGVIEGRVVGQVGHWVKAIWQVPLGIYGTGLGSKRLWVRHV